MYRVYKEILIFFCGLLSLVSSFLNCTQFQIPISPLDAKMPPASSAAADQGLLARNRTNRRVRETPQPFPASSFPVPVSTQLKPQNKPATNKSRIGGVAESPHPDSVKIYDYPFLIIRE